MKKLGILLMLGISVMIAGCGSKAGTTEPSTQSQVQTGETPVVDGGSATIIETETEVATETETEVVTETEMSDEELLQQALNEVQVNVLQCTEVPLPALGHYGDEEGFEKLHLITFEVIQNEKSYGHLGYFRINGGNNYSSALDNSWSSEDGMYSLYVAEVYGESFNPNDFTIDLKAKKLDKYVPVKYERIDNDFNKAIEAFKDSDLACESRIVNIKGTYYMLTNLWTISDGAAYIDGVDYSTITRAIRLVPLNSGITCDISVDDVSIIGESMDEDFSYVCEVYHNYNDYNGFSINIHVEGRLEVGSYGDNPDYKEIDSRIKNEMKMLTVKVDNGDGTTTLFNLY